MLLFFKLDIRTAKYMKYEEDLLTFYIPCKYLSFIQISFWYLLVHYVNLPVKPPDFGSI